MKPNFLIFMTDQQRGDMQPTYQTAKMPNVSKLADNGVVFRRAYCPSPHCCPSRATFFSGLYPSQHGVWNNVDLADALSKGLYDNVRLFSEDLKENGYHLYYSGKWHVSALENPKDRGFEELYVRRRQTGEPEHKGRIPDMRDWRWFEEKKYLDNDKETFRKDGEIVRQGFPEYCQYGETENPFGDEDVVRRAKEKIADLPKEEPFCMYVGTLGPHDPYFVPERYLEMYPLEEIELPKSYTDSLLDKPNLYRRTQNRFRQLTEEEQKKSLQHYLAFCSYEDALFGEILDELEQNDLLDSTIVIYLSDHGDYAGAHGLWTKGLPCFEEAYHICSVIGYGGIRGKGRAVEELVSLSDYAPTILELADVSVERKFAGRSLVPFLEGTAPEKWRTELYTQSNGNELYGIQRAVFDNKFKFVYNGFDFDELYDLVQDPEECHNLAGEEHYADMKRLYYKKLWEFAYENQDMLGDSYITTALMDYGAGIMRAKTSDTDK